MLRTITHSRMVNAIVLESYIHFSFMYTTDHIFLVLPIKDLINKYGKPTTPFELETGRKPSLSHLRVLFLLCIISKATSYVGTMASNMCHQAQKCFRGIFVGISHHKKGYLMYVPSTRKLISSYDVFFMKFFLVR